MINAKDATLLSFKSYEIKEQNRKKQEALFEQVISKEMPEILNLISDGIKHGAQKGLCSIRVDFPHSDETHLKIRAEDYVADRFFRDFPEIWKEDRLILVEIAKAVLPYGYTVQIELDALFNSYLVVSWGNGEEDDE